jgi:hypothetical protein
VHTFVHFILATNTRAQPFLQKCCTDHKQHTVCEGACVRYTRSSISPLHTTRAQSIFYKQCTHN